MNNVKLTYFHLNARASVIRMLLFNAGVKFEDIRVTFEEFAKTYQTKELHFLPELEIDGKTFSQHQAIAFYLAKKIGGSLGTFNLEEEFETLYVLNADADLSPGLYKVALASEEDKNSGKVLEYIKNSIDDHRVFISAYQNRKKGKFYLGDTLTLADLFLWQHLGVYLNIIKPVGDVLRKEFPTFFEYIDGLWKEEVIAKFVESEHFLKNSP